MIATWSTGFLRGKLPIFFVGKIFQQWHPVRPFYPRMLDTRWRSTRAMCHQAPPIRWPGTARWFFCVQGHIHNHRSSGRRCCSVYAQKQWFDRFIVLNIAELVSWKCATVTQLSHDLNLFRYRKLTQAWPAGRTTAVVYWITMRVQYEMGWFFGQLDRVVEGSCLRGSKFLQSRPNMYKFSEQKVVKIVLSERFEFTVVDVVELTEVYWNWFLSWKLKVTAKSNID